MEKESRECLCLRGDQCFVIWSGVYFFSAQVLLPSSPLCLLDRYSASTKVLEKACEHVSQSTLTQLKAMEFEISQAAVSLVSPFSPTFQTFCISDVECIRCRCYSDSCDLNSHRVLRCTLNTNRLFKNVSFRLSEEQRW